MAIEGFLLVDKPAGPTSHDVINQLRHLSGIRRIGHAGTLDPLATGLLLVCFGRATRLLEYLLDQPKRYEAAVRLGQSTDTFDAQGTVVSEKPVTVMAADIEQALEPFRGPIVQYAPAYSAIKRDGIPLYKLARQGLAVDRPAREVNIYNLEMLSWQDPHVYLDIICSSGTYIRSLADDLGNVLGCGGHINALRRTAVASFMVAQAATVEELENSDWSERLLPPDTAVRHLPKVEFSADAARGLLLGQQALGAGAFAEGTPARAYDKDCRFLGIVISSGLAWQPRKMFVD